MIRRLAHLCFDTTDLDRMVDFYSKDLGLPVKFDFKHPDGRRFGAYIDCGDSSFIEIFHAELKTLASGGTPQAIHEGNRYGHFCLEVTGLKELKADLEAKNIEVSEIRSGIDGSLQAWIKDPDGNGIELMEYTAISKQIQRG